MRFGDRGSRLLIRVCLVSALCLLPLTVLPLSGGVQGPVIDKVRPRLLFHGLPGRLTVRGSGFDDGAQLVLRRDGAEAAAFDAVVLGGDLLTCSIPPEYINGLAPGDYSTVVRNSDGTFSSPFSELTVRSTITVTQYGHRFLEISPSALDPDGDPATNDGLFDVYSTTGVVNGGIGDPGQPENTGRKRASVEAIRDRIQRSGACFMCEWAFSQLWQARYFRHYLNPNNEPISFQPETRPEYDYDETMRVFFDRITDEETGDYLFRDEYRAERYDPSEGTFYKSGQSADRYMEDPRFYLDLASEEAVKAYLGRIGALVRYFIDHGAPFDFFAFSELRLQHPEIGDPEYGYGMARLPLLYQNSPTFSEGCLRHFRNWLARQEAAGRDISPYHDTSSALFPRLPGHRDPGNRRTEPFSPSSRKTASAWQLWAEWRHDLWAGFIARAAWTVKHPAPGLENDIPLVHYQYYKWDDFNPEWGGRSFNYSRRLELGARKVTGPGLRYRVRYGKGVEVDQGVSYAALERACRRIGAPIDFYVQEFHGRRETYDTRTRVEADHIFNETAAMNETRRGPTAARPGYHLLLYRNDEENEFILKQMKYLFAQARAYGSGMIWTYEGGRFVNDPEGRYAENRRLWEAIQRRHSQTPVVLHSRRTNLAPNPDFESGTKGDGVKGWGFDARGAQGVAGSWDASKAFNGCRSLLIAGERGRGGGEVWLSERFIPEPGCRYRLRCRVQVGQAAGAGGPAVRLLWFDNAGGTVGTLAAAPVSGGDVRNAGERAAADWTEVSTPFEAPPPGARFGAIELGGGSELPVRFDAVRLDGDWGAGTCNLIENHSAEFGPRGWFPSRGGEDARLTIVERPDCPHGTHALAVESRTTGGQWVSSPFYADHDEQLDFVGRARTSGGGEFRAIVRISWFNELDQRVGTASGTLLTGANDWTEVRIAAVSPPCPPGDASRCALYGVVCCVAEGNGTAWFDDMHLTGQGVPPVGSPDRPPRAAARESDGEEFIPGGGRDRGR